MDLSPFAEGPGLPPPQLVYVSRYNATWLEQALTLAAEGHTWSLQVGGRVGRLGQCCV